MHVLRRLVPLVCLASLVVACGGGASARKAPVSKPAGTRFFHAPAGSLNFVALAVGADDSVCATMALSKPVDFGGGTLTPAGDSRLAIACFSAKGEHRWSKVYPIGAFSGGAAIDASGNLTVVGSGTEPVDFGGGMLPAPAGGDNSGSFFIASFGPDGSYRWAHRYGDSNGFDASQVAADAAGNVYVSGTVFESLDLGIGPVQAQPAPGFEDLFLARFTPSGDPDWDAVYGGPQVTHPKGLTVSASGEITLAGEGLHPGGGPDFGEGPFPPYKQTSGFIAGFDSDGTSRFAHLEQGTSVPGTGYLGGFFNGAAAGKDGRTYVSANYNGDDPNGPVKYLFAYGSDGSPLFSREEVGALGGSIAVTPAGDVFVVRTIAGREGSVVVIHYELIRFDADGTKLAQTDYGKSRLEGGTLPAARLQLVAAGGTGAVYAAGDVDGPFLDRIE